MSISISALPERARYVSRRFEFGFIVFLNWHDSSSSSSGSSVEMQISVHKAGVDRATSRQYRLTVDIAMVVNMFAGSNGKSLWLGSAASSSWTKDVCVLRVKTYERSSTGSECIGVTIQFRGE